jgi:hypothetical protein
MGEHEYHPSTKGSRVKSRHVEIEIKVFFKAKSVLDFCFCLFSASHDDEADHTRLPKATILPRACSLALLERNEPPTFQIQSSSNRSNKNCRLGYIEGSDTKTFPTKPQKTTPSAACLVVSLYRQGGARAIIVMPKLCVVE